MRRGLRAGLVALALAAPAAGAGTLVAFGSCADQRLPQPIWDAVIAARPDLFVFAGDNVYGDVDSAAMTALRDAYRAAAAVPGLVHLRREVAVLATWDDHDYGANDAGGDFAHRAASRALFLEFWQVPDTDPRRSRAGLYHARTLGAPGERVQVIVLDTRSFRSPLATGVLPWPPGGRYVPDPDPEKTMLGGAQWRWLAARLREPAQLRLVVSSVQVLPGKHRYERWGQLPAERRRLFDLVRDTGAAGVVFLSGDRHFGALYRSDEGPYPLWEVTSSSLNRPWRGAEDDESERVGALYADANFGAVAVDWQRRQVTLSLRGVDGAVVREARVALDDLQAR